MALVHERQVDSPARYAHMIQQQGARLGIFLLLLCICATVFMQPVQAQTNTTLPDTDLDSILNDTVEYDNTAVAACIGGSSTLVGTDNAEKIFNFLISKGLNAIQAAGVMGNLQAESNFDPGINETNPAVQGSRGGYGIAQWTGSRRVDLEKAAEAKGVPVNDLAFQLDFMYNESANERKSIDYPGVAEWEGLKRQTTVRDAVIYWERNYERAGIPRLGARLQFGEELLVRFGSGTGNGTVQSGGATSCITGEGGVVIGNVAFPVDERWYRQNPEWFTKPHHNSTPASDIPVPTGTPIYAVLGGTVTKAPIMETNTSYGQGVEIESPGGIRIIYAHGIDGGAIVKPGDTVQPGQLIMHSGSTGNSTGPHLHLEIRIGGRERCPQPLLSGIMSGNPPDIMGLPSTGCTK